MCLEQVRFDGNSAGGNLDLAHGLHPVIRETRIVRAKWRNGKGGAWTKKCRPLGGGATPTSEREETYTTIKNVTFAWIIRLPVGNQAALAKQLSNFPIREPLAALICIKLTVFLAQAVIRP